MSDTKLTRTPSDFRPIQPHSSEFEGLWALIAIGSNRPNGNDPSINERENKVSRYHLLHELIKRVSRSIGIRRQEIPAFDLLPIGLVLFTRQQRTLLQSFRKAPPRGFNYCIFESAIARPT